ncbi:MAG: hypothetical protein E6G34_10565 [Actinobacteria bacterium]|nr:MAG: hypothetical protein E6G34_10565 [Actinomycetota bacterium]
MSITLITGPANAGKAQLVMDAVRRHVARGEEPLLVVPTRADAAHYRRELAEAGAAMGARVLRFEELIEEAVRRANVASPALGDVARSRVLTAIAAGAGVHRGGGFVRALGEFSAELKVRRISPARIVEALEQWADADERAAPAAAALARHLGPVLERYEAELARIGRADPEQRANCALDALRRRPVLWASTPVLFYGFDDLTRLQLDAIETLGAVVDARVTVTLAYEPARAAFAGRAGSFQALAPLAAEHRELAPRRSYYAQRARTALSHLERSLFVADAGRGDPGGAVRLLEAGGERAEFELVAREIAALLREGVPAEEIAVALRAPSACLDLLEEVLSRAGIPFALARTRRLGDTAIGSALLGALRCAGTAEGAGREDVFAWLRAPGVLERPELADRLEARALREGAQTAEDVSALWEQERWPLDAFRRLRAAQGDAKALVARTGAELEWLFMRPRRGMAEVLEDEATEDARALSACRRALEELEELAQLAPELAPDDPAELARVLESVQVRGGWHAREGAVAVVDPLNLRARRVRALFLCRLQAESFPAPERQPPLLSRQDRLQLAELTGLSLADHRDELADERHLFYAAVSRPQELLVLSWHCTGDDAAVALRSPFIDDVCEVFDERLWLERAVRAPGGAGREAAQVRTQARRARPLSPSPLRDGDLLAELSASTWSASSLQTWISCPMRWLVERVLRPEELEPGREQLARGALAHATLRETFEGLRTRCGSARLTPERLGDARELLDTSLARHEQRFSLSAAPERRAVLRRRLHADLHRYLRHAAEEARDATGDVDGALEPTHLEQPFGMAADAHEQSAARELPCLDLGGGVKLRGRIDRIDVDRQGRAVIRDYKGASASPAAKWIERGDLQVALYMRAAEQLLGLRAVGGFFQPLTGSDLRGRGVLEAGCGVQAEGVASDVRDGEQVRELLAEATAAAREAAAQAARGELEARPQTCTPLGGCAYPTICRCER